MNVHLRNRSSVLCIPALLLTVLLAGCSDDSPSEPCSFAEDGAGTVTPPVKVNAPVPQYTEEARRQRIQGVVILQAVVNCQGLVENVTVLQSLDPGLDQNSVDAISRWTFRPAMQNGKAVSVFYNLTVNFRLQEPEAVVEEGVLF